MALSEVGSEVTLGSNTESGTIPDIAALHNGKYVVVWETTTGGGSIIRGQIFNAGGTTSGSEFTVSQAVTPGVFYKDPAITVLANGDFVVGWGSGASQPLDGINVYAQRFNQAGAAQGSLINLNTETNPSEGEVSLAALSTGGFVASWHEMSLDIDGRFFDANGNAAGAEFNLAASGDLPEMAGLPGGGFVAVWYDAGTSRAKGAIFNSSGSVVAPLNFASFTSAANPAHVASFADGSFVVVWQEFDTTLSGGSRYAVRAQRYEADGDKDGSVVDVAIEVAGGGGSVSDPRVATLPDGGFTVTWDESAGFAVSPDIYARQFDANDAPVADAFVVDNVASDFQEGASIAADADGNLMVAWINAGLSGEPGDIHTQVFTTGTGPVEPAWTTIDSLHDGSPTGLGGVTALAGGGYFSLDASSIGRLYGADGELIRQFAVEPHASSVHSLSGGGFVLAWKETLAGPIVVQRFDATGEKIGAATANPGALYQSAGNDPVLLSWPYHPNTTLARSSAIMLADGSFLEIWQEFPNSSLIGQRYDANLVAVGAPVTIVEADENTRDLQLRQIVQLDNGNFALVEKSTFDSFAVGEVILTVGRILDSNLAALSFIDIFADGDQIVAAEGGFLRVAQTVNKELTAQFYDNAGAEVGTPHVFAETPAYVDYYGLIALEGGDFVAAWDGIWQQLRHYTEVNGDGGPNTLNGATGHDIIRGRAGTDELNGLAGDDVLMGGADADAHNGGIGIDTADYSDADAGVGIDLDNIGDNTGFAAGDTYNSIERIVGSKFQDILAGNGGNNVLDGGAGNDLLSGGGGTDGDDTLIGGYGDDWLIGGTGSDELNGGAGLDTASYATATDPVVVNMSVPTQNTGDAAGDVYVGIEKVIGSDFNDMLLVGRLLGSTELDGGSGRDTLGGGSGRDTLDGGSGLDWADYSDKFVAVKVALTKSTAADVFVGGSGPTHKEDSIKNVENLIGGSKSDTFTGDAKANVFTGMAGKDILDGKGGADTADYSEKTQKITVALNSSSFVYVYANGTKEDRIKNIENVTGGSGADKIAGDGEANILSGLGSKDILIGADGKDTLIGGAGKDTLEGGADADHFRFDVALGASNVDHILSFTAGSDKIDLENAIFAVGSSLNPGEFIAKASGHVATKNSQRIVYDQSDGSLWYDPTGKANGATDAIRFAILDNKPASLAVGDFDVV